jgi:Tfp pilus assembly protein PilF
MISTVSADKLFSVFSEQAPQMDALAQSALSSGITFYQEENYSGAIREFKRAISLSPQSDNALKAYDFLATAFLKVGDNNGAIKAYQSAIRLVPDQEDLHIKLADILLDQGNADQAIGEYKKALNLNPTSTADLYSLGQAYLAKGSIEDAKAQFEKIIKLAPKEYGGYYGLGQTYYKAGENEKAVEQFNKVIDLKEDFLYARVDLGYALADLGQVDKAYEQAGILQGKDSSLAAVLNNYIYRVAKPEFLIAYSDTGFNTTLGPRTPLSALDSYLSAPNASQDFTMKFIFNKKMDIASVENPYNWRIARATPQIKGGPYNWGMPVPSNEVNISLFPERVNYDFQSNTAVVTFRITQNDLGNGNIDPSHIVFQFLGQDAYGNKMNPSADQYSGISKIV